MTYSLAGKLAVVTAAGRGIGRAVAEKLAEAGAGVVATDVDVAALEGLSKGIHCEKLDATNGGEIAGLAGRLPATSILVNCAGVVHRGTILDCTEESWSATLAINCTSQYRMIRAFLPAMLHNYRSNGALSSIINIASIASSIKGVPDRCAYGVSKAAVVGLTKSVASDFIRDGVRCNAIAPGTIDTPSLRDRINAEPDAEQARKAFVSRQPMGRLGRAEEIADLAGYLASDASAFMTGTVVVIDGGHSL